MAEHARKVTEATLGSVVDPEAAKRDFVSFIIAGFPVVITIDGKDYNGYVSRWEIARYPDPQAGEDYALCLVRIPALDGPGDDDEYKPVRVAINKDGTMNILPDED